MGALSVSHESATLIAFPGAAKSHAASVIAPALKAHRLPELLTAQLLRTAGHAADPHAALTHALTLRMTHQPLNLARAHGILLVGPSGAGKSTVARMIADAARPRESLILNAREGLARFRAGELPDGRLVVMEADGFHPLNPKARGAFAALNDIADVETVGVVSAAGDAEDVAETIAAFRFRRLIVTGLDRTRRLGALAAAATSGAAIAHLARDSSLESLEAADLAELLLTAPGGEAAGISLS
jgi:hypothetical protein